jgi:hypothetical protein
VNAPAGHLARYVQMYTTALSLTLRQLCVAAHTDCGCRRGGRYAVSTKGACPTLGGFADWDFEAPAESQIHAESNETDSIATESCDRRQADLQAFRDEAAPATTPEIVVSPVPSPGLATPQRPCNSVLFVAAINALL